ncbi:hypothetical protein CRUP_027824 [Coryphaenoides rupestris]|nr:hypothetical protein CRUP_027824 [Coryphaenoides rupestris]
MALAHQSPAFCNASYDRPGDLRGYVSQQDWMFRNAEQLELQRMACEIAAGVTHLHKHNFLHR